MKSGAVARRDALRFVLAAVHNEQVARGPGTELDDAAVLDVLRKQAKMRRDSIEAFEKGGRSELAAKESAELTLIESYLPAQLTDDELRTIVERAVAETGATGPRDMSKVMSKAMAEAKDRADGKRVSAMVQARLKGMP